jgi:DNA-binding CsgD family transcriptional regulator
MTRDQIARNLGIGVASVYKALRDAAKADTTKAV